MKGKLPFIIGLLLALMSIKGIASCQFTTTNTKYNAIWNVGNVIVSNETPVGTVLFTKEIKLDSLGGHTAIICDPGGLSFSFLFKANMSGTVLDNGVYSTNLPGVGIKVSSWSAVAYYGMPTTPQGVPFSTPITVTAGSGTPAWGTGNQMIKIELVKTKGEMTAGSFTYSSPDFIVVENGGAVLGIAGLTISGNTIIPCSTSAKSIQVIFGDMVTSVFKGVGPTSLSKNFNLDLNCNANTKVNASLSGTANADIANSDILALTNAGTAGVADGLGVQILYNGSPLKRDTNLLLKTSTGGVETFPFAARYYQTKSAVKPGKANATATLNLTYQ
ncbi:fimbrial protein [Serratia sp. AKBS12]|uniref:fimbrial protein n=1 Tax=Serratia sp. AKBS12 TaxID=2974597 RepID=UPI002164F7FD|nr:fimbrial protein [Serratia sp. AKBS12]MCS3406715.1 fimbrial protein [Serratia sp. AKBS12]